MPHALLLKYPGTNCDVETERALRTVGFPPRLQPRHRRAGHVASSSSSSSAAASATGTTLPADAWRSWETERFLGDALHRHHAGGGLILGICNGFQILTKLGILPSSSLIDNKSERFECLWARLVKVAKDSPFLQGLPDEFELPSAHAEGRLVTRPRRCGKVSVRRVCGPAVCGQPRRLRLQHCRAPRRHWPRHGPDAPPGTLPASPPPLRQGLGGPEDWGWGLFLFKSALTP